MSRRRGWGGWLFRLEWVAVLVIGIAVAALAFILAQPYKGFPEDVVLDIARGTSTSSIADQLATAGVIHYPWQFLAIRTLRPGAKLQAGEYRFSQPASAWTIYDRMVRGDVFYYEVVVPEGHNMFDIAGSVDQLKFLKGA